jgi:ArsR family transcriptional regulator
VFLLNQVYAENVGLFKALSDAKRLMIVDMLSCGELCACMILEKFKFSQPTLSYHMKMLCDCGLVNGRKEGKWMYYTLNENRIQKFKSFLNSITIEKEECICNDVIILSEECCAMQS